MHYIFIYNLKVNAWNISVNVVDAFHKDGCVMEFRTARIALTKSNVQEKVRYHLYSNVGCPFHQKYEDPVLNSIEIVALFLAADRNMLIIYLYV